MLEAVDQLRCGPVIAKMKEFYPPDGIRPKGVSISSRHRCPGFAR
jgi:hypothetical protein